MHQVAAIQLLQILRRNRAHDALGGLVDEQHRYGMRVRVDSESESEISFDLGGLLGLPLLRLGVLVLRLGPCRLSSDVFVDAVSRWGAFDGARVRAQGGAHDVGDLTGLHYTNISRYERGLAMPNSEKLRKLASALGVSGDFLIGGTVEDVAKEGFGDRELLNHFQAVQKLPAEDRFLVKKFLEAFIFQRNVQGMINGTATG